MVRQFICISCPMGCLLTAEKKDDGEILITGNSCPRGLTYGRQEMTDPRRMLTTCMKVENGRKRLVSCKTEEAIPKDLLFSAMEVINTTAIKAPVRIGDTLIRNILGTGIDIIATSNVEKEQRSSMSP